ncbi:MAG: SufS family cysteine desulfurase [Burkholderiales bacterium]
MNTAGEAVAVQNPFDVQRVRAEFPILARYVHGKPLVYLDNAATSQKPHTVIEALERYYTTTNSNIHRGVHALSEEASRQYEETRTKVRRFINARQDCEIVFVRGTTEAINLVAQSYGRSNLKPGDEVLITELEHHSNIVPWQMVCEQTGALLRVAPINEAGEVPLDGYRKLLGARTRMVAVAHLSNALGTVNPVRQMIELAHAVGAKVLVDGAQSAPHVPVDVQHLDCDFYAFSGHKLYGPTGSGVLYGKAALLDAMPPYQGGGDMIRVVRFDKTLYNVIPYKFEAGTPDIAGVIGMGVAIDYLCGLGLDAVAAHEDELLAYATAAAEQVPGLRIIGNAAHKASILSFTLEGVHPHDIGTIMDRQGVAIRAGHHCAMPVMEHFCLPATARASFALYNTTEEIDRFIGAVGKVQELFR